MISLMKSLKPIVNVPSAIIYFVLIILIAHLLPPKAYQWQVNTISDLGAQQYENAWLVQLGFIGFGALMLFVVLSNFWSTTTKNYSDLLLTFYALCILLTGIWSVTPFTGELEYSLQEDNLHTLFAQLAGFAFSFVWLIFRFKD